MDDLPDSLDRLTARLETLERRVYVLEHPSGEPISLDAPESILLPAAPAGEAPSFALAGGAFSVLGKAMLGIAGAYVLRAVAESSSLPKLALAGLAIAYAILWLVWAARVPAGAWVASTIYACTSALILAPMLWELTLRFKVLSPPAAAGVLGAFVCAASALAWQRNLASVFWVANVTAGMVALALSIATHEMAPFIAVVVLMAVLCEFAAGRNREPSVRPLAAAAADLGVWALIFIYSGPQSTHADYPLLGTPALLAPGLVLFLVYGASVAFKTALNGQKISVFETIQTTITFLLAASSLLYFVPNGAENLLGIVCLALSTAGYAAVFTVFDRGQERRNYQVYATWSAALFLSGSVMCLPPMGIAVSLSVAAIGATVLGVRLNRTTLKFHGLAYLLAAAAVSGLLDTTFRAFAGPVQGAPAASVWLISACAILCYAAGSPCEGESWKEQFLHLVSASVAIGAAAALLVEGLLGLIALNVHPGPHHLAFIRTLTICLAALALTFGGAHWHRKELTRIGYAALVVVAAKLVFEDLRQGHLEFIAGSIFLFAVTLIAVPRLSRTGRRV
jgi:hypothetical protein